MLHPVSTEPLGLLFQVQDSPFCRKAQKGEYWTWNQISSDPILLGGSIVLLDFLFSHSKASNTNNSNFMSLKKKSIAIALILFTVEGR